MSNPTTNYQKMSPNSSVHADRPTSIYSIVLVVTSIFSCAVICAALATNVYTRETNTRSEYIDLWKHKTCIFGGACIEKAIPVPDQCTVVQHRQRALQCFAILSLLGSLASCAVSVCDFITKERRLPHWLPVLIYTLSGVMVTVEWSIAAGSFHHSACSGTVSPYSDGYKLSVSFALFLSLWFLYFGVIPFYCVSRFIQLQQKHMY